MVLEDLDLIDRKILSELDRNSRISYSALGKKIRVAKETVKYRITQMESRGIIKGHYTVLNLSKIGFFVSRLYLRLQNISPAKEEELMNYLVSSKNTAIVYRINGPYHIALAIWTPTLWDYESFWTGLKSRFGEFIAQYHSSMLTEYLEFPRGYLHVPFSNKISFGTVTKTTPEKLDSTDLALLDFISTKPRASLASIANHIGTSIMTARYRLKALITKKVIIGFRTEIDLASIGREYYKVDLFFRKYDRVKEITQHILSHPDVVYTERTLISGDLEFDLEVPSFHHFINIMNSFKSKFPDDIRDYTYYSLVQSHKMRYSPLL